MNATHQTAITRAINDQRPAIIRLLQAAQLPVDDLPAAIDNFFVAVNDQQVVGTIGLEPYGDGGLLRSMAVSEAHRNKNIASGLMQRLEDYAGSTGIRTIYLLTETAAPYFERKGYQQITRDEVPEPFRASSEFSHVCPVSATVMKKQIG